MSRAKTPRPATEAQRRILARAAKTQNGVLVCPPEYDVRLWMTHLTLMSKKGYIYRAERIAYITDVGRSVLERPRVMRGSRMPARQSQVLEFVAHYINETDRAPSQDQIARRLNLKSCTYVKRLLKRLEDKGLIKLTPYLPRGIELVRVAA